MTSKIELYREVLTLEPASRVFFPLANMLAEQGQTAEAMDVLRRGVAHHPDHLEARFLLVELLTRQSRREEALDAFEGLSFLLAKYPSVLSLWAEKGVGLSGDASLALRFLAQSLGDPAMTLAGVLSRGLESLAGDARNDSVQGGAAGEASVPDIATGKQADESRTTEPERPASPPETTDSGPSGDFSLRGADEVLALAQRIEALEKRAPREDLPPECASQTNAQVKTRTMADLLAKHGDLASALDIYEELLPLASSELEREELSARIQELKNEAQSGRPAAKPIEVEKPRAKLVSMLEALANRLDARATA
ncbi:tetratricopeptide repeat protein [Fundidesulfovibrio butyratiphilus]